ncbi:MAG: hypothetical protein NW201_07675, partial [Gemmatimonadales bacterium]|nr:hypothetical protein [Gemmatimonadales bacterium]
AAAAERGAALAVVSREPARAAAFAAWAATLGVIAAEPGACAVLVNATPVGLADDALPPIDLAAQPLAQVALDLVYRAGGTAWVRAARARGLRAADGRGMLVAQGARALECWFPRVRAPREVMHAAVEATLR